MDEGKGVAQDHEQAVYWYRKAAEQGNVDAQHYLKGIYKEGNTVSIGYTSYLILKSYWETQLSDNLFLDQLSKPDAMFLFVELIVKNDDTKARMIPPFKLIDENGAEYETSSKSEILVKEAIKIMDTLNPDVQKHGYIVFDIPQNHKYKLKISGGIWSGKSALIELSPKSVGR